MSSSLSTQHQPGVTLIELLVALGVLSVILLLALPSFQKLYERQRYRNLIHQLTEDLKTTKMLANKERRNLSICPLKQKDKNTNISQSSLYSCGSTSEDWAEGWIIFYDDFTLFSPTDSTVVRVTELTKKPKELIIVPDKHLQLGFIIKPLRRIGTTRSHRLPNGKISFCAKGQQKQQLVINIFSHSRLEKLTTLC